MQLRLLIIDNYDSFTYNLVQLVEQAGVTDWFIVKNDELTKVKPDDFDMVIISPGPGIAKEANELMWFVKKYYKLKPILGICLGHEAIAEIFGGKLMPMPESMHGIKNKGIVLNNSCIFSGLPINFNIGHYHSWIIDNKTLPSELEIIMKDENDFNMAIKHVEYNLTGLQFHPESIMTEYGLQMMKNWISSF